MSTTLALPVDDQLATLGLMVAAGGPLLTPKLGISSSNITPGPNTVLLDFTPAAFTGSAPVTIVWAGQYIDPLTGLPVISAASHTFIASVVAAPETIYSYFLTDSTGATYHGGGQIIPPRPITAVGDGVLVQVTLPYGG